MSIIQKVKVNNDWVTVKGGTSTSKKEIYIGAEEPTDENVKLWIDTDEEYEGGEGGSIDPAILEDYAPILRDFNNDFNNDYTN